ncbi:CoA pyrophosphatase [Anaerolineales bacterium HSG24]|nr:CoA pyrophosphatase [Anaerolineales bacterium HSG24]
MSDLTIEQIQAALSQKLPGQSAQYKMAPQPDILSRWDKPIDCRNAAVLLFLYPHITHNSKREWHIILIRRSEYMGLHRGQISFPGGQNEANETLQTTALREAHEEIGLLPEIVKIIGKLSCLYTPPSNFCIYPYIGYSDHRPDFQADTTEVAELIEPPLSLIQNPTIRQRELRTFHDGTPRHVPFFNIHGHKVWGATAMILNEFLTTIKRLVVLHR